MFFYLFFKTYNELESSVPFFLICQTMFFVNIVFQVLSWLSTSQPWPSVGFPSSSRRLPTMNHIMAIEVMIQVAIGQYLGSGGMTLVAQLCPMLKGELKPSYDERWILWKLNPQVLELPQWQWWVFWTSTTAWSLPGLSSTSLQPIPPCQAYLGPPVVTTSLFLFIFVLCVLTWSYLIQLFHPVCVTMLSNCFWLTMILFRGMVEYKSLLQGIWEHNREQADEGQLHCNARAQQDHGSRWGVLGVSSQWNQKAYQMR